MNKLLTFAPIALVATMIPLSAQCQSSSGQTSMTEAEMNQMPAAQQSRPVAKKNIVEVAVGAGSFQTLVAAVKAAGLVDTLSSKGPFTVFAPSDAAFEKLPKGMVEKLLADKKTLTQILTYHVVPGRILSKDISGTSFAKTAQGQSLLVKADKSGVSIDSAKVVKADIMASNGVIHVIDSVILPRKDIVATAKAAGSFKTLTAALKAAGLDKALQGKGPFTVFAPTDAAFDKLPKGTVQALLKDIPRLKSILLYHVVAGRTLSSNIPAPKKGQDKTMTPAKTLQGTKVSIQRSAKGVWIDAAKVVGADVIAGNGVIHVIDSVILPKNPKNDIGN